MQKANLENTHIIKLKLVQKKEYAVIGNSYCWCINDATNINQEAKYKFKLD